MGVIDDVRAKVAAGMAESEALANAGFVFESRSGWRPRFAHDLSALSVAVEHDGPEMRIRVTAPWKIVFIHEKTGRILSLDDYLSEVSK